MNKLVINSRLLKSQKIATTGILILLIHFIFSKFAINLTDEGVIPALSQRILNGEMPYIDFISIRPILSPIIHLPEVYFFGSKFLIFSRLIVIIQISISCGLLTESCLKTFGYNSNIKYYIICLILSVFMFLHNFQIMVWATIDGIFFTSIGIYLITTHHKLKFLGYFTISLAVFCKQSFIFFPFFCLFLTKDYRNFKTLIFSLAPFVFYFLVLNYLDIWSNFFSQISSGPGVNAIINNIWNKIILNGHFIYGYLIISSAFFVNYFLKKSNQVILSKSINYFIIIIVMAYIIKSTNDLDYMFFSRVVFGMLTATLFSNILIGKLGSEQIIFISLILLFSFCTTLSSGYSWPIFLSGVMITIIFLVLHKYYGLSSLHKKLFFGFFLLVVFINVKNRFLATYSEKPIVELKHSLTNISAIGDGIYTCENIKNEFNDLNNLVEKYGKFKFAIIPDHALFWINSKFKNPISIDWIQSIECPDQFLPRIQKDLINLVEKNGLIFVQKYSSHSLSFKLQPIQNKNNYYPILPFVRNNFTKVDESAFFEVYSKN